MKKAVGVLSLLGLLIQSFCANFSDERDFVLKICRTMKQTPVKISNYKHAQYEYDTVWLSPQPDGRECARTERYNHNTGLMTVRVFKNGNAYQWVEDAQHQVQKDIVFKAENEEFGFYYFPVESLADFPASTFTVSKITYRGQPCWKILGCYEPTDENIRNYVKCKPGADSPDPAGVITGCEIIVPADSAKTYWFTLRTFTGTGNELPRRTIETLEFPPTLDRALFEHPGSPVKVSNSYLEMQSDVGNKVYTKHKSLRENISEKLTFFVNFIDANLHQISKWGSWLTLVLAIVAGVAAVYLKRRSAGN